MAPGPEMPAGTWEAGMLKPELDQLERGRWGWGSRSTIKCRWAGSGETNQVGAMETETPDSEAQLLCGVCYCLPSPSCRATVPRKDVLNWTEIQICLEAWIKCLLCT